VLHGRLLRRGFEPGRSAGKAEVFRRAAPELPAALWNRRKSGFYIPIAEWGDGSARPERGRRRGAGSRRLAGHVLRHFGVEIDRERAS
jgi:hypothetical protein